MPREVFPFAFFAEEVTIVEDPVGTDEAIVPSMLGIPPSARSLGRGALAEMRSLLAAVFTFYDPVGTVGEPVPASATYFEFVKVTLGVTSHALIDSGEVGVVPSAGATTDTYYRLCPVPEAAICTG